MIDESLLAECRNLALTLAPELSAAPLYILARPACLPIRDGVLAIAIEDGLCVPLEEHLIETGAWQGRGPMIVFGDVDMTREICLGVFIHELAHVLPARRFDDVPLTAEQSEEWQRSIDEHLANEKPAPGVPRWSPGHGRTFIRIALHLWWRLALAGEVVPFDGLCAGFELDLSPAFRYWQAIGNEPVRMQHATFAEILATQAPAAFMDEWHANLRYFMSKNPQPKCESEAA